MNATALEGRRKARRCLRRRQPRADDGRTPGFPDDTPEPAKNQCGNFELTLLKGRLIVGLLKIVDYLLSLSSLDDFTLFVCHFVLTRTHDFCTNN